MGNECKKVLINGKYVLHPSSRYQELKFIDHKNSYAETISTKQTQMQRRKCGVFKCESLFVSFVTVFALEIGWYISATHASTSQSSGLSPDPSYPLLAQQSYCQR